MIDVPFKLSVTVTLPFSISDPLMDCGILSDAPTMDLTNEDITLTPVELPDFD